MKNDLFERQIRLFGNEGQERLQQAKVTVIGVGGTGSHVVQQLAYLGVGNISLIDMDKLANTNKNRLIGSFNNHPSGKPKTEILTEFVNFIDPEITINPVPESIYTNKALNTAKKSDFIFSCFDNDGPRAFINEFVQAHEIPCLDIATGIQVESMDYGGRIIFIDDSGCLVCLDELDQEEIRLYNESPEQRHDRDQIYGINESALRDSGPSVVSINGVIASLAVTEFMVSITGIRKPVKHLVYDGKTGMVRRNTTEPQPGYYFCNSVRGNIQSIKFNREKF